MTPRDPKALGLRHHKVQDIEPHCTNKPIRLEPRCIPKYRSGVLIAKAFNVGRIGFAVPRFRPPVWNNIDSICAEFKVALWEQGNERYLTLPNYIYDFYYLRYRKVGYSWADVQVFLMHIPAI